MEIHWQSEKLKKELEDKEFLTKQYDEKVARYVAQRFKELKLAETYTDIPQNAHKHSIKDGKKTLYFAVDLPGKGGKRGKWRLAFKPEGEYDLANQKTIVAIKIIGIKDYH